MSSGLPRARAGAPVFSGAPRFSRLNPVPRCRRRTILAIASGGKRRKSGRAPYDAVLSDLAPKTSGVRSSDEARSLELAERALGLSLEVLKRSGVFVVKVFMGGDFESFLRRSRAAFLDVRVVRPEASVARGSKEVYLVCRGPQPLEESAPEPDGLPPAKAT